MKVKVKIFGLDCPNCARNLQNEINKLEGIKNASIDFVKNSLTYESEEAENSLERIKALSRQLEPNATITSSAPNKNRKGLIIDLITLSLGILIGVALFIFKPTKWVYWPLYVVSALLLGYKTYIKAIRLLFKGIINENLLITISVVGASFISEHMEGLMVIALYTIGKIFESLAVNKTRRSIEKLARMQPEYANLLFRGKEKQVSPSEVAVGKVIVVKAGEKIPIDGKIIKGQTLINNQSLTGESVPVSKGEGDEVLSGGIVLDGTIEIKTTAMYKDSAISKIMDLVENASENKSKTETFISKLTRWYTLGVVACALLVTSISWIITGAFKPSFYKGLIFLVVSCPCAFAISVPLAYFSGLGNASKNGILIKGSNFLDACSGIKMVAFDKTGTLTTGEFKIKSTTAEKGFTKKDILFYAALGEQYSLHPLAKAIVEANKIKLGKPTNVHEVAGKGVEYTFRKDIYFVGRKDKELKATTVEVYKNEQKIGSIELRDTVKPTSILACEELKKLGIKTALLSGDNVESANLVAKQVGIDEVHSSLLPEQKYEFLKEIKNTMSVGYVGDGINDAPSLAVANVGFSMGINGAPASIEASDVVIVDDNPQKISSAVKISKNTRKIVWQNIILSAIIKITFLTLGTIGITGMLAAVFADVGVTLLAILNSVRALHFNPNKKEKIKD